MFITLLRIYPKKSVVAFASPRLLMRTSHNAISTRVALVRGCSIGTNRAQNRQLSAMIRFKRVKFE
jgi:hypothetical protein